MAALLHLRCVDAPEDRAASALSPESLKTRISKRRRQGKVDFVRARSTVIPLHQVGVCPILPFPKALSNMNKAERRIARVQEGFSQ